MLWVPTGLHVTATDDGWVIKDAAREGWSKAEWTRMFKGLFWRMAPEGVPGRARQHLVLAVLAAAVAGLGVASLMRTERADRPADRCLLAALLLAVVVMVLGFLPYSLIVERHSSTRRAGTSLTA